MQKHKDSTFVERVIRAAAAIIVGAVIILAVVGVWFFASRSGSWTTTQTVEGRVIRRVNQDNYILIRLNNGKEYRTNDRDVILTLREGGTYRMGINDPAYKQTHPTIRSAVEISTPPKIDRDPFTSINPNQQ